MGKVFQNKQCDFCPHVGKVIETWGKKYCRACWDKKPKKGDGNSGMVGLKDYKIDNFDTFNFDDSLILRATPKGNKLYATLYLEHYPGSKGIVGRQCNYFVERAGKVLGIVGCNSPPLNYKKFNEYFGEGVTELNWVNNNVFRLIIREKNLGTKVLKIFRNTIKVDYKEKYGDDLVGIVTFVEPPRSGAVYKADNWDYLGMTLGKSCKRRGDHGKWINKEWTEGVKKLIFAKHL